MANTMQIYVASLSDYSAGKLHGEWIDVGTVSEMEADIVKILKSSKEPNAEEWAIHDYNDFPNLGENPSLEEVEEVGELIDEHGDVFLAALDYQNDIGYAKSSVEENFVGSGDSLSDIAYDYLESTGMLQEVPEFLRNYIDYEAYGRDMDIEGWSVKYGGTVYLFSQ